MSGPYVQNGEIVPVLTGDVDKQVYLPYNPQDHGGGGFRLGQLQPVFDFIHNAWNQPEGTKNWFVEDPKYPVWQYPQRIELPETTPNKTVTQKQINREVNGKNPTIQDEHNQLYNSLGGDGAPSSHIKNWAIIILLVAGGYYLYKHW